MEPKYTIFYLFVVSLCFAGVLIGYHNLDTGHNMRWLEAHFDISLQDTTLGGDIADSSTAYRSGAITILISSFTLLIAVYIREVLAWQ